jgi:hypothetical protein
MSFNNVLCPDYSHETGCDVQLKTGDFVMIGLCQGPVYEVRYVHAETGRAWVVPVTTGREGIVSVAWLRPVDSPDAGDSERILSFR